MFIAEAAAQNPTLLQQALMLAVYVGFIAACSVYSRMLRGISQEGPKVRADLLASPEKLAGLMILLLFIWTAVNLQFFGTAKVEGPPVELKPESILSGSLGTVLLALICPILIVARGGSLVDVLGLDRSGFFRSLGLGFVLALLVFALVSIVKLVTISLTGSQELPQQMVQSFNTAVGKQDIKILGAIIIAATFFAPFAEELLFRGIFYPLLSPSFGRFASAFFCGVVFAGVHDTWTGMPALTVFALCMTVAYERTGALLVPFFAHMWFNAINLSLLLLGNGAPLPQ